MVQTAPIVYTLSIPDPETHYLEVEATLPSADGASVEVAMAVWTPGSYLVREYARFVEGFGARGVDGRELQARKTTKNRWRIDGSGAERVVITYRVYCHEMSVRGNWIEADFALLNGAASFVTLAECLEKGAPSHVHELEWRLPRGWANVSTTLARRDASSDPEPRSGSTEEDSCFVAASWNELADSPIYAGNPALYPFEIAGKEHWLLNEGEGGIWDGARSARDVASIVAAHHAMWGNVPYEKYIFFNLITESGGGLEHANSCVLMTSRWKSRVRESYLDWLSLVSHEFFHTWNVKRLRPVELGPFDYETENYSRSLWVAEGVTNYYTDLLLARAGLCDEDEYLGQLSKFFERLHTTPGRAVQSLAESSFDAWIKLYRPHENSANTTISYYVKGAVVAFVLNARIRKLSDDQNSLDDVLRAAFRRYSGDRGYSEQEIASLIEEIAGAEIGAWLEYALESTDELEYDEAFDWFGLRFEPVGRSSKKSSRGKGSGSWLGVAAKSNSGRLIVTQVVRGSPAQTAGINAQDEIIALDDYRVASKSWEKRLEQYRPGDRITVLVARREEIRHLELTLAEKPQSRWRLEVDPEADPTRTARRAKWLGGLREPE